MDTVNDNLRRGKHVVYDNHAHVVLVTKYRSNVLTNDMLKSLEGYMQNICLRAGATLDEFNGEDDHVHLVISFPPHVRMSDLVNSLKGVSARLLRRDYGDEIKRRCSGTHLWSPSYYMATTGGVSLDVVRKYVQNQKRPS